MKLIRRDSVAKKIIEIDLFIMLYFSILFLFHYFFIKLINLKLKLTYLTYFLLKYSFFLSFYLLNIFLIKLILLTKKVIYYLFYNLKAIFIIPTQNQ